MTIGKRELIFLAILLVLVYVFLIYTFVIVPVVPQVDELNSKYDSLVAQKEKLDLDIQNKPAKLITIKKNDTINERISEYLVETTSITDGIYFIEKISNMIKKDLSTVSVARPTQVGITQDGKAASYYSMAISFNTTLNYEEIINFINYIEGNSRKAVITSFKMSPKVADENTDNLGAPVAPKPVTSGTAAAGNGVVLYNISMTLEIYSQNVATSNGLNEYARKKFDTYTPSNDDPYKTPDIGDFTITEPVPQASATVPSGPDFKITLDNYMTAGDNLRIAGVDKDRETISYKTKTAEEIEINVDAASYTITLITKSGKRLVTSGICPGKDMTMQVTSMLGMGKDSKDMGLNVKIINNSGFNIKVLYSDSQRKIRILDRNGAPILQSSPAEKVTIS